MKHNFPIFNLNYLLFYLLITFIGLDISVIYVKYSYSNFLLFFVGFALLSLPMIFLSVTKKGNTLNVSFILSLILLAVFFNQYLLSIGSNYIQGTDGPFNLNMILNLLNENDKFNLHSGDFLFNQNFYGLQLFCNVLSIFLNYPVNIICLYITPLFGVISIFIYFTTIKNFFPINLVLISTILFGWSISFVGYGIELRPENLGLLFVIIIFHMVVKKHTLAKSNSSFSLLAIITSISLVITHSVATIHSIIFITIFYFCLLFYSKREKYEYRSEHISLIIFLLFIFYLLYTTGSFTSFINMLYRSMENIFLSSSTSILDEKGVTASSSEIPFFITVIVWIERILFIIGFLMLASHFYSNNFQNKNDKFYFFMWLLSLIYIVIITLLIPANSLSPARFYRFFEIPLSIIKSIFLLYLIEFNSLKFHNSIKISPFVNSLDRMHKFLQLHISPKIRLTSIIIIILFIMMNSVLLLPRWIINTEINNYHENPYASFSDSDIFTGEFAKNHIDDVSFIGGFRTTVIFGIIGKKKVISPNSEDVDVNYLNKLNKPLFFDIRTDQIDSFKLEKQVVNKSYRIYDNRLLSLNIYP